MKNKIITSLLLSMVYIASLVPMEANAIYPIYKCTTTYTNTGFGTPMVAQTTCWIEGYGGSGGGGGSTGGSTGGGSTGTTPTQPNETYCGGNPILISSGRKYQHTTDYTPINGLINLDRYYLQTRDKSTLLGHKWAMGFEYSIEITQDAEGIYQSALLNRPDGNNISLQYNAQDSNWYNANGQLALFGFSEEGQLWIYQNTSGVTENYNSAGKITSRINMQHQGVFYQYNDGILTAITSSTDDVLTVEYNAKGFIKEIKVNDNKYKYNYSDELLTKVSFPDGTKYDFEYSDSRHFGALTQKNINGKLYARWAYNELGKGLFSEHADGAERTEFTYGDNFTTVKNALGKETTYHFTTINGKRLPTTIEGHEAGTCIAANKSYTYDVFGNKDVITDWQGNATDYDFDDRGLIQKEVKAFGTSNAQTTAYAWHPFLPLLLKKTTDSLITEYSYNRDNRIIEKKVTSRSTGGSRIWSYQYLLHDNGVVKEAKEDGSLAGSDDINIKTFDEKGNLLTNTNALGHTITFSDYDQFGNPGYQIDINGVKTKFKYDVSGRLIESEEKSEGKNTTKFKYNALGQVVETKSSAKGKITYTYDNAYRKTSVTNALGNTLNFTLNAAGNITQKIASDDNNPWNFSDCKEEDERVECNDGEKHLAETLYTSVINKTYDALSRITHVSQGGEQLSTYAYDANNNIIEAIDGEGHTTSYRYDALNRKISTTDANNQTTYYQYNKQNLINAVIDARGNKTTYSYNDFGELIEKNSPDSGLSLFTYNETGQKISSTRADGTKLTHSYDVLGRLLMTSNQGSVLHQYSYDNCKNGMGRLCSVTDLSGSTQYSYHKTGELDKKEITLAGQQYKLHYKYDKAGRVKSIKYPSGVEASYKYDKSGKVTGIKVKDKALVKHIAYKPFGGVKGWMFGNGQQRAIQYDAQSKIERILSTNVQDLRYQYDLSGNIISLENLMHNRFYDYAYDDINRLTVIAGSDLESYEYDSLGNRLTGDSFEHADQYQLANDSNRLLSVANGNSSRDFTYDDNGNIISDEAASLSKQFTYNVENRMSVATVNGKTTTYAYNAHGKRVSKTLVDGTQTHYIYGAAGKLLAESKNGKVTKEYIYLNGQLIGLYQNKQLYYVHTDQLGRPEIVTDKHQNTVWQANNKAFDREVLIDEIDNLNIGFPGQYWDEEKRSWYNGFRDYDSTIGRYLQSDPIGVNGGINTYNYVLGNPLVLTDLLGLLPMGSGGGFPDEPTSSCSKIIDSTSAAVYHYYNGNGESVELGDSTKKALRNHADQEYRRNRIVTGQTSSMSGNYTVDMTYTVYHVGRTRVDYQTTCQSSTCTTIYTGFVADGFWDIFSGGDQAGSNGELGGTPYAYNPYTWAETYSNPYP